MQSYRYSRAQRLLFITAPFALVVLALVLGRIESTQDRIHTCYIQRQNEKPLPTLIPLGDGVLHDYSVIVLWIAMLSFALLGSDRSLGIYSLAYTSLWFHCTYILLAALKVPLNDFACAGRHVQYPNGISGHYCYFVFVSLTAPIYSSMRLQANPQAPNVVLKAVELLMTVFTVGAAATLYRTFYHGYHSLHQIILGTAMGMFSHASLDLVYYRDVRSTNLAQHITVLLANSLTSFTLYYRMWPHEDAGPAITGGHIQFHIALWVLLGISAYFYRAAEEKVSTD